MQGQHSGLFGFPEVGNLGGKAGCIAYKCWLCIAVLCNIRFAHLNFCVEINILELKARNHWGYIVHLFECI